MFSSISYMIMEKFRRRSSEEFERYVAEGIDSLPPRILERLSNVVITVEDEPTPNQLENLDMRERDVLYGLYEGIPQTERGAMYQGLPDRITIYKKAIEANAKDEDSIKEIVRSTVWHEVAHHFGMEEEEIRDRERRKGE